MDHKVPLSLVRIGDGENICLSQGSVRKIPDVMREPWAVLANRGQGQKGVTLPNLRLRDELVQAIRSATIVGILPWNDQRIVAPQRLKRPLTAKIFSYYRISPNITCDACINRYVPQHQEFWQMLQGQRILVISQQARRMKSSLVNHYGQNVTGTIFLSHNRQINKVLSQVKIMKDKFDVALISAGVNAVILAPKIARISGKVAIDFGQGHKAFFKRPRRRVALRQRRNTLKQVTGRRKRSP